MDAISVIEVALDDDANRITCRRVDSQYDDSRRHLDRALRPWTGRTPPILCVRDGGEYDTRDNAERCTEAADHHRAFNLFIFGCITPRPRVRFHDSRPILNLLTGIPCVP
jgi:hypothetical protein